MRFADAQVRLAGVPLVVRPSILLLVAAIGWTVVRSGHPLWLFVCYLSVLFASVLVHELGHVFALRLVGVRGQSITLHGLGGQVEWDGRAEPISNGKTVFVALAGPAIGLLFGAAALAAIPLSADTLVLNVLAQVALVNVVLNVGNLLPALPLDGGQVLLATLNAVTPRGSRLGAYAAVYLGSVVGILLVVAAYDLGNVFLLLVGGQILFHNTARTARLFSEA